MWPLTHVCNANYATIMISPESDWSISKCFERFIGGNLISEAFPWSNIVQIKSCVNSRFCTSNWTVFFFFFCGNFLDLMKNKLDVGRISRYSFAIFMERGIETKRSKRIKDNENIPGIPPISTLEYIPPVLPYTEFFKFMFHLRMLFPDGWKYQKSKGRSLLLKLFERCKFGNSWRNTFNIFHVPYQSTLT